MAKTIFEEMGGTYVRQGDYFIPALKIPKEDTTKLRRRLAIIFSPT